MVSFLLAALRDSSFFNGQGDSLHKTKVIECTCGLSVVIVGLGLYSYYVRELLASLALFTGAFFLLALAVAGVFLLWCAAIQAALWTRPASRNMIALSRRLVAAYVRP
jgi:uncharacterized membrane protein